MSGHIKRSHNVSCVLYHLVCPIKYRRKVFTPEVEETLKDVCRAIGEKYELHYIEIGTDEDHAHFLIQSVPMFSPKQIVQITKSITGREIFKKHSHIKREILWGGHFWTAGYYINTVGKHGNETVIQNYVKKQGQTYTQLHRGQLTLFEGTA